MNKGYKILRAILVTVIALPPVLAVGFYILLSLPGIQNKLRALAENELSELLGTNVEVGDVSLFPFDEVRVDDLSVNDDFGAEALKVERLTAGIDLYRLLSSGKIVIDYAAVKGLRANIYKTAVDSSLNIAGIIKRLQPKKKKDNPTPFSLKINTLVIDDAAVTYFEEGAPAPLPDKFDKKHIRLYDLNLSVNIPRLSNDDLKIQIYSLNFRERSGFAVDNIKAAFVMTKDSIGIDGLTLVLPNSQIETGGLMLSKPLLAEIAANPTRLPSDISLPVVIKDGSHITPSDIKAFLPATSYADFPIYLTLDADVRDRTANIRTFRVFEPDNNLLFDLEGRVTNFLDRDSMDIDLPSIRMTADGKNVAAYLRDNFPKASKVTPYLLSLGAMEFNGAISGNLTTGTRFSGNIITDAGDVDLRASARNKGKGHRTYATVDFSTEAFDLGSVLPGKQLGYFSGKGNADISFFGKTVEGKAGIEIDEIEYKGYVYSDARAEASRNGDIVTAKVDIDDPNARLLADCNLNLDPEVTEVEARASIGGFRPDVLGLTDRFAGHSLSAEIDAHFLGNTIEGADGELSVRDVKFVTDADEGLHINEIRLNAYSSESPKHIDLTSDFMKGSIEGRYDFGALVPMAMDIVSKLFPALVDVDNRQKVADMVAKGRENRFELELTLLPHKELYSFFRLPVSVISNTDINVRFDNVNQRLVLMAETPYLQQGGKVLDDTALSLFVNGKDNATVYATTSFPTKKGLMSVVLSAQGNNDKLNTRIDWEIARAIPINGIVDLTTYFYREPALEESADGKPHFPLLTQVHLNPGQITFGETLWNIMPSDVFIRKNDITVKRFRLMAGMESIGIEGKASKNPDDVLEVNLQSMHLIDIFETLQINKALIGGKATGQVFGSQLLTKEPIITAPLLTVDSISYNGCVLGDAKVNAGFDTDRKSFSLNADISQHNGCKTRIYGNIYAAESSLDITFDTNKVNIGFLKPFMSTWAKSIDGIASGRARLFGTFKNVDLEGDVLADSVNLGIDITNTTYTVKGDSLHMRPGKIAFNHITLHDHFGHTARLNGTLTHRYFHDASFNFNITDVDRMLVFDTSEHINPRWYGHIFGIGNASIIGKPGYVDIDVKMETAAGSWFKFALTDMVDADDYTFMTFRDRTKVVIVDSLIEIDNTPAIVKEMREKAKRGGTATSNSDYNVRLDVQVEPDARITLVMDPMSGDNIKATGTGRLLMAYDSANEDFNIKGSYVINSGKYNFRMQDIIVREFNILKGSSIAFRGNPDDAELNIKASYFVPQANLADLDPSFSEDKDLTRRVVPVNAIIHATGDMRQPDIDYDLDFPGSPQDVQRRAMSVMGTAEMKQRQILYLLALNRFYTPDYMASTRSNNELLSVASSTVSSQIGNMLGSLSENWTVAPNLRSERGDFSDVEVDVALTSHLLNNRLIFNGNFGYRDPSMNTNQFVGDFDIEYLLNPAGTWRLKAYNRYNDQNYFLRSAATTQGVGIVYTRDFNNMFGFLKRKKKTADKDSTAEENQADSTATSAGAPDRSAGQ